MTHFDQFLDWTLVQASLLELVELAPSGKEILPAPARKTHTRVDTGACRSARTLKPVYCIIITVRL